MANGEFWRESKNACPASPSHPPLQQPTSPWPQEHGGHGDINFTYETSISREIIPGNRSPLSIASLSTTHRLSIITTLRLGIIWSQLPTQKPRQNDAPQRIRTAHRRHRRTAEELRNQRTQDTSSTRTPPEEAFSSREFSRRPSGRSLLIKRALPEARAASFLGFSHVVPVKNTPWASSTFSPSHMKD